MTDPVFVHELPANVEVGSTVELTGAEARHLRVKRIGEGDSVVVTDGESTAIRGSKTTDGITVTQLLELPTPQPRVTIVQAIPKAERSELSVDLMVQAGVDRIIPWAAHRCIAKWDGKENKALAKWQKTAVAATKQSRRLVVPIIEPVLKDLKKLPDMVAPDTSIGALHEESAAPFHKFVTTAAEASEIALIIGPEGGISPEEIATIKDFGGHPVLLGPQVLRTATAGAVALGAIGVMTKRWNADEAEEN